MQKKNNTQQTHRKLGDLLIEAFSHPDAPDWLQDVLYNGVSDNTEPKADVAAFKAMIISGGALEVSK